MEAKEKGSCFVTGGSTGILVSLRWRLQRKE
jgi:hypothetical protein